MEQRIGSHLIRVEGDIAVMILNGDVGTEDMRAMLVIFEQIIAQHGRYATLVDSAKMGGLLAGARQSVKEWPHVERTYGNAIFGASFATRTVLNLITRAMKLIGRGDNPLEFFKTEFAARDWLSARGRQAASRSQTAR